MHAQDLVVDKCRYGQLLEHVYELFEKAAVFLGWRLKRYFRFSLPFQQRLIEGSLKRPRLTAT